MGVPTMMPFVKKIASLMLILNLIVMITLKLLTHTSNYGSETTIKSRNSTILQNVNVNVTRYKPKDNASLGGLPTKGKSESSGNSGNARRSSDGKRGGGRGSMYGRGGGRGRGRGSDLCCCSKIDYKANSGHKLTENVLDLHTCNPAVSFRFKAPSLASDFHIKQIANLLGTKILSQQECVQYYIRHPTTSRHRIRAYSRFSGGFYDAIIVRDILRDVQKKVLTSCNMVPPSYAEINITSLNYNNNRHMHQQPSTSVNILRRGADRVLLNAQEILDMCKGLRLHCQIIETDDLFQQPESKDICHVLNKFAHAVNIGVQGAEMIYPHYTSSRMILVHNRVMTWNYTKPINRFRFGEKLFSGERKVGTNFISTDPQMFDWFYLEFGAHFGNYLNAIAGDLDVDSLEHVKAFNKKPQCQVNPSYCANCNADMSQIKTELMALIDEGHLLTIDNSLSSPG